MLFEQYKHLKQISEAALRRFIAFLKANARDFLIGRETDAGSGPVRCVSFEQAREVKALCSWCPCGLHQSNLVVGRLAKGFYLPLLTAQHGHASLIQTGNFWLRCLLMMDALVDSDCIIVHHRAPSAKEIAMAKLVMTWFPHTGPAEERCLHRAPPSCSRSRSAVEDRVGGHVRRRSALQFAQWSLHHRPLLWPAVSVRRASAHSSSHQEVPPPGRVLVEKLVAYFCEFYEIICLHTYEYIRDL